MLLIFFSISKVNFFFDYRLDFFNQGLTRKFVAFRVVFVCIIDPCIAILKEGKGQNAPLTLTKRISQLVFFVTGGLFTPSKLSFEGFSFLLEICKTNLLVWFFVVELPWYCLHVELLLCLSVLTYIDTQFLTSAQGLT